MKNKKILFGAIILLFAITGFCNIPNVSAFDDTVYIPPSSIVYYSMGYLENKDEILINEIDSDGAINVYIMNSEQLDILLDSGGLTWIYLIRWKDIVYMSGWSIDITVDGYYYVVLYNKDLLFGRTVYVNIGVHHYSPPVTSGPALEWLVLIIYVMAIGGLIAIPIVLVRKHKRKVLIEDIKPEKISKVQEKQISKSIYCSECGIDISDKSKNFCSVCGTKLMWDKIIK